MAVFPFFRLPRELRDQIYAEAGGKDVSFNLSLQIGVKSRGSTTFRMTVHSLPLPNLILVSRQFKKEYESETQSNSSALVKPANSMWHRTFHLEEDNRIHHHIRSISRMTIRLRQHRLKNSTGTLEDARNLVLRALLPFMSSLESATIDDCHLISHGQDLPRPAIDAFQKSILQYGDRNIAVQQGLLYTTPLFSLPNPYLPPAAERDQYPTITRLLQGDNHVQGMLHMYLKSNYATWRVNLPTEANDTGDLKLELLEAGSFDEQALLQNLESRYAGRFGT